MPGSPANSRANRDRRGAGHADADARLEDAVPLGHAAEPLVVVRAVQRVGERADELPGRVARELRVAVERDHVPHAVAAGRSGRRPCRTRTGRRGARR